MSDETLEAMCDNEIMQKLGWMSGVLADSGYGEQAGDVMRAMAFIHEQAQEIEKLRAALEAERERCYLAAVSTTCSVEETADYYSGYCDGVQDAAAALKETGK